MLVANDWWIVPYGLGFGGKSGRRRYIYVQSISGIRKAKELYTRIAGCSLFRLSSGLRGSLAESCL